MCVYHGGLTNQLYYGDCLKIMEVMGKDSVDLIYLDPPFNSNRAYNAICKDEIGGVSYPRWQILSVKKILEGKRFETPLVRGRAASDQLRFDLSAE